MIRTINGRPGQPPIRQQRKLVNQSRQFGQIQIEVRQPIGKLTCYGLEAPMPDESLVDTAVHGSIVLPKYRHTVNALRTPSSWKPYPQ